MSVDTGNPKRAEKKHQAKRSLHWSDLSVPLFIFSGFGAVYLSGMTIAAAAYTQHSHSAAHLPPLYWPALGFFPCFLLALLRNRWASVPIWLCCAALFVAGFMPTHQSATGISLFQPGTGMVLIPALTELARFLRGHPSAKRS
jgi:cell division protein FtsW (lipid II flippase)